ncbi:hypothetical protein H4R34_001070 [Dimargaris verticillata]|uniref:Uncharacterized protein n=1 Tax=Dimargaris verticillata TaxID=2761393 RepID=A0A9W8B6X9_9FUNG|nr:hypothetical protein H4R34_001070 [Dimargaris verticillata]
MILFSKCQRQIIMARLKSRAELTKLRQQHTQTMGDLLQFLEKHYPPVHAVDQPHPAKRRRSASAISDATFSLKDMLEDLMNLSVSHPDDPYYTLMPGKFWEPHVQLLLNAGIVVHHPNDAARIKLFEFHL